MTNARLFSIFQWAIQLPRIPGLLIFESREERYQPIDADPAVLEASPRRGPACVPTPAELERAPLVA